MACPWGHIDYIKNIERGISWVSTPSHGGFRVSHGWAKQNLTQKAIDESTWQDESYLWYQ